MPEKPTKITIDPVSKVIFAIAGVAAAVAMVGAGIGGLLGLSLLAFKAAPLVSTVMAIAYGCCAVTGVSTFLKSTILMGKGFSEGSRTNAERALFAMGPDEREAYFKEHAPPPFNVAARRTVKIMKPLKIAARKPSSDALMARQRPSARGL